MADLEEEDLKMALRMSMQQHESPEPKRSKPEDDSGETPEESPEVKNRRLQRELMAAAAEKRMSATKSSAASVLKSAESVKEVKISGSEDEGKDKIVNLEKCKDKIGNLGTELSSVEANHLFAMIFGNEVSKDVLAQWSNQGIRFSPDPETSMGLVQHEGGPCGVLAAIQAFVLKYLLFPSEESEVAPNMSTSLGLRRVSKNEYVTGDIFSSLSKDKKSRALVRSMSEILFLCGSNEKTVISTLNILDGDIEGSVECLEDEAIAKALEDLSIDSGSDLRKVLRVHTCTSRSNAFQKLRLMLPAFRSRMGALLFLISALLSRGLDNVQTDRDDPSQPLVTAPFGHASQEIVNLLLSGKAAANVFDGRMDLGGGMFVNGISTPVEVGFLTLLESLNFCKVGQYLKCPRWPIWVVGSESHYTVLFALDNKVQDENELESRESQIRRAFDAQDQSGGGGFISVEGFHQVLKETSINLPSEKLEHLCGMGFIVWSEFWQVLLDIDKSLGGVKDSSGLMGKKVFDLYHFNGIAKSIVNGSQASSGAENPIQRPRLTKLRVSVPPRWTPEEFMANVSAAPSGEKQNSVEVSKPEPAQHAPLVDCIRTRWNRAVCNWEGDAPSIV
ncbi:ubiquitin carboxyl-terminal hydrolase MINDY-3-like [Olea europaea var. sylvestris]|uniref:ubiquitinyl hydrolase 1 n=1 Tax=Olea europaea subsp. europaea TaxID=158383 RepID=A0A8S0Q7A7_OLEEU|nr:ubiquitin carboxyl-terminal hydrolase MINDY-3-like [Olea europaea var. sylvestris]CAA2964154.1 ubiquitin carboxyl-terminal hydrolase FAM188A [Olea europaea subsp. europaea]